MFRRRGFTPAQPASQRIQMQLAQAHRLMNEGHYWRAAKMVTDLGQTAFARGVPRAPYLYLQAGRAYLMAGDQVKGLGLTRMALHGLAQQQRWAEMDRVGKRVISELSDRGMTDASEGIRKWLEEKLAGVDTTQPKEEESIQRPILPTKCPSCGGSVDPQSVTWLDEVTVECLYCGSAIRAEN